MQGKQQAYKEEKAPIEEAALAFKRFILDETAAFESAPEADLFRVNTLAQMLDRFDDYVENGANVQSAIVYTKREFSDLAQRMREEGFAPLEGETRSSSRWPLLSEDEAAQYIKESSAQLHKRAIGIGLCSACCMPLMLLSAVSELFNADSDPAALLGLCGMFGMIALGVYAIVTAKTPENAKMIRKKRFSLTAHLRKKLTEMQALLKDKARKRTGKGVAMLVCCVLPIFLGAAIDELFFVFDAFTIMGVGGMFAMIGAGVYELVVAGGEKKAVSDLLKIKD